MSKTRSVKIVGAGDKAYNWKITDAVTGEPINMVSRVEIVGDADGGARAILYIHNADVDVEIPAEISSEQRTQEARIAEAVIAALTHKQERYAGALERVNQREIERIVIGIIEERLPDLIAKAVRQAIGRQALS